MYRSDIEPLRFDVVAINSIVSDASVEKVRTWLKHPERVNAAVEKNFEIGRKRFSYEAVEEKLKSLGF